MTAKEFFSLVSDTREKQREYFRTRSSSVLSESKALERQVDDGIRRVRLILTEREIRSNIHDNPELLEDGK